jgi:conjugative relaxase-like TrwC/TraI family protein
MLTIGKLGSSPDQLGYYEQQVAQGLEDYFSGRGEAPGRWTGRGAALVGANGDVDRAAFMRAMAGCDPRTGEQLKPVHGRARVAAFDLTFSAPKSVSVLFAIADEGTSAALLAAHEAAVAAALDYVEREACFTRRGHNGVERVRGDGFLAAAYRHRLSRAGDPQLHTHVVVANMTRAEGRWTSLEAHGLYEHKSAGGAVYRAVLRTEVRERLPWVSWHSTSRGLFEIDGVPAGVLREFSRRRAEIEERAEQLTGVSASKLSRERRQGIALATRKAKEYGVDGIRWQEEARARAAEHGLGPPEMSELVTGQARQASHATAADVADAVAERLSGAEGLTGQHNTFAARHAMAEIAGAFDQGTSMGEIRAAVDLYLQHGSVVPLGSADHEARFTTRGLLTCEGAIVGTAERRLTEKAGVLPTTVWARPGAGQSLNADQLATAQTLTGDGQGISLVQALAGTGKTRLLAALASAYLQHGFDVTGVAPTGRAARELGDAAGIAAVTVHRLLADRDALACLSDRSVVLFDEAGTAPTRPSAGLLDAAAHAGAKVIAVGDAGQLPSVAAGGWFGHLAETIGGPELRDVMRQRDRAERAALAEVHDGNPDAYIALKRERGDLQVHAREADAITTAVADWDRAQREYGVKRAVVIARDNATRDTLNDEARQLRAAAGNLGPDALTVADRDFRTGDRVIARRNDRVRDVDNGTLGTVVAIDLDRLGLTVATDGGELRHLDVAYVADHLEHAYALTGHGAQGATVDWAAVVGRPSELTREWAYTALSRARENTRIHLISETSRPDLDRARYAPEPTPPGPEQSLKSLGASIRRSGAEPLALMQTAAAATPVRDGRAADGRPSPPKEPDWRVVARRRQQLGGRSRSMRL